MPRGVSPKREARVGPSPSAMDEDGKPEDEGAVTRLKYGEVTAELDGAVGEKGARGTVGAVDAMEEEDEGAVKEEKEEGEAGGMEAKVLWRARRDRGAELGVRDGLEAEVEGGGRDGGGGAGGVMNTFCGEVVMEMMSGSSNTASSMSASSMAVCAGLKDVVNIAPSLTNGEVGWGQGQRRRPFSAHHPLCITTRQLIGRLAVTVRVRGSGGACSSSIAVSAQIASAVAAEDASAGGGGCSATQQRLSKS